MSRTKRVFVLTLQVLAAVSAVEAAGCGGDNEPSTTTTAGGTGGATTGSGGATTGSGGSGGATTGTGGAGGTTGGSGGGGTGGSGGGGSFSPLCSAVPRTQAGEEPTKGGVCTASDPQLCYKTCGPQSIGFKWEKCMGGVYAEQSGCDFPPEMDYACYKIPNPVSPTCPAVVPQASQNCDVAECTPCNLGGLYADSGGAQKEGFCICPKASSAGTRKWSCASTTAWPCPSNKGC
jgi:hypothetical protein